MFVLGPGIELLSQGFEYFKIPGTQILANLAKQISFLQLCFPFPGHSENHFDADLSRKTRVYIYIYIFLL
jgi:hypothetical protein